MDAPAIAIVRPRRAARSIASAAGTRNSARATDADSTIAATIAAPIRLTMAASSGVVALKWL